MKTTKKQRETRMEHLSLGRPMEASLSPVYECQTCGEKLYTRKTPKTKWQEWLFTKDGRRHFKTRCNMETQKEVYKKIKELNNNEYFCFNMFEDGGAVCYKCNGMYLLFEIPQYGGENYIDTYFENQINDLIILAYSWT